MARVFNGTDQALQSASAIDLTGTSAVSVSFWHYVTAWPSGTEILLELSADYNGVTTGFITYALDGTANGFIVALSGDVDYSSGEFQSPSTAAWHHFVAILDKSAASGSEIVLYIDGSLATRNGGVAAENTNAFGSHTLNVMARNASSLWHDGQLADIAIWKSALSSGNVTSLNGGTLPSAISPAPAYYWKLCGDPTKPINLPEQGSIGGISLNLISLPSFIDHPTTFVSCPGIAPAKYRQFPKPVLRQPITAGRAA